MRFGPPQHSPFSHTLLSGSCSFRTSHPSTSATRASESSRIENARRRSPGPVVTKTAGGEAAACETGGEAGGQARRAVGVEASDGQWGAEDDDERGAEDSRVGEARWLVRGLASGERRRSVRCRDGASRDVALAVARRTPGPSAPLPTVQACPSRSRRRSGVSRAPAGSWLERAAATGSTDTRIGQDWSRFAGKPSDTLDPKTGASIVKQAGISEQDR
jgi:hypothetical protein